MWLRHLNRSSIRLFKGMVQIARGCVLLLRETAISKNVTAESAVKLGPQQNRGKDTGKPKESRPRKMILRKNLNP
jgi:hypothetical protein